MNSTSEQRIVQEEYLFHHLQQDLLSAKKHTVLSLLLVINVLYTSFIIEPPTITMDSTFINGLTVRAGTDLQIQMQFEGKPTPKLVWEHNQESIRETDDMKVVNTVACSTLTVRNVSLCNAGEYTLNALNHYGSKSSTCGVQVLGNFGVTFHKCLLHYCSILDKPGIVSGPIEISNISEDRCKLSWSPPKEDGGSKVTNYIIEKRQTSRLLWTLVIIQIFIFVLFLTVICVIGW